MEKQCEECQGEGRTNIQTVRNCTVGDCCGQCNYGDRCESCNGKGEVTIEEEDVEIKLLNLEIEILGTLEGLKRYQEKAPKEWEHLNTYKEATIKIELLTTLSKLI